MVALYSSYVEGVIVKILGPTFKILIFCFQITSVTGHSIGGNDILAKWHNSLKS